MTFGTFKKVMDKNNIPENARLMSDSGWECGATDMDGIYYNKAANTVVFTQNGSKYDSEYHGNKDWKKLYGEGVK